MDAVSSCGTFVSTYHNGRSLSPEDVKIIFTFSPSWGPKTSCRLLWWKSFCLQRDEVQWRIGMWRGRRKVPCRQRGVERYHEPPKGTEHWNLLWVFFTLSSVGYLRCWMWPPFCYHETVLMLNLRLGSAE